MEHLATKYRALFSSQTTTEARLNDIRHVIQDKVTCEGNAFAVTVTEVCGMTSKLKINKSDGLTGSSSDHFVYAPHRFAVLFTMLINVMLVHGYMPDDMLASVLVPIPKDPRASLTNSGNYRAIALYSSMGKIVDMLISDRYSNQLMTSNAQFAFKKCHSTSMCTALVKEVVSYYNGRNTNVYACLLDATKAFDCVRYDKLFELLLKKDIPGTVIRLLLDSYTRQYAYMRWNNCMSTPIKMENGVKQGGVLSPTLFCIYFDELLRRLRETDVGCHVGHMSYAAFGYAHLAHLERPFPYLVGVGLVLRLHSVRSRAISWVTSTAVMSSFSCWFHVFLGRPRRLVPGMARFITVRVTLSASRLWICPNQRRRPQRITSSIGLFIIT